MRNLNEASDSLKQLVDNVNSDPKGLLIKPESKERKVGQ
jgi:hypothetical protein